MTIKELSRRRFIKSASGLLLVPSFQIVTRATNFLARPAASGFTPNATTFAGDGQCRMSKIGFGSNGNKGIFSVWVKFAAANTQEYILYSTSGHIRLDRESDNTILLLLRDSAGTVLIQASSTATIADTTGWHHIIASWDRDIDNEVDIAIDGTVGTSITTFLSEAEDADDINYSIFQWFIGGPGVTEDMNGCISELYINVAEYIDLTVAANVQKWRSSGGAPVNLGSDGSTPTGTAPIGYFKDPFNTFTVNSGTGGNFTKEGTTAFSSCTAP